MDYSKLDQGNVQQETLNYWSLVMSRVKSEAVIAEDWAVKRHPEQIVSSLRQISIKNTAAKDLCIRAIGSLEMERDRYEESGKDRAAINTVIGIIGGTAVQMGVIDWP